jgi:hypothetical protein
MNKVLLAGAAFLTLIAGPATAADMSVTTPILKAPPAPPVGGFWVAAEFLYWSSKGDRLPPLVTTSPPGTAQAQAGVLGAPGTSVLFGDDDAADRWRPGVRLRGGYWFDPQRTAGVEGQFFALGRSSTDFSLGSSGNPILAHPFVNAVSGLQDTQLIAFPGLNSGSVSTSDTSQLLGAGAVYRRELCRICAWGSVSALIGYRFMRLHDALSINGTSVAGPGGVFLAGTTIAATDQFDTVNNFHGLDLGLTGDVTNGAWRQGRHRRHLHASQHQRIDRHHRSGPWLRHERRWLLRATHQYRQCDQQPFRGCTRARPECRLPGHRKPARFRRL